VLLLMRNFGSSELKCSNNGEFVEPSRTSLGVYNRKRFSYLHRMLPCSAFRPTPQETEVVTVRVFLSARSSLLSSFKRHPLGICISYFHQHSSCRKSIHRPSESLLKSST
jgi:hypothetical protein